MNNPSLQAALVVPFVAAMVVLACRNPRVATAVALAFGVCEEVVLGSIVWMLHTRGVLVSGAYLRADGLTAVFILNLGLVFVLVLVYAAGYLRHLPSERFSSPRWFYALLYLFLFTMLGAYLSANLGLLWIVMEGTTLASALLVGFYNTEGAVEAGWKYLVVCTVGLAFALFGTIVLYLAAVKAGIPQTVALDWASLDELAPKLVHSRELVKLAFVFLLIGYGTKVGFVPMHLWLPDAHAEAPTPISAMLSAGLLNCAMYALLRYDSIVSRATLSSFSHHLLLAFGAASLVIPGLLMLVQRDLKRLLAYSSVEHMGIIATGIGLGGALGLYGALLHTFNHSVAKSLLFFSAGSVRENMGTLRMDRIAGLSRLLPWTSSGLVLGGLAIVGLPPFSLFVSEFAILNEAFSQAKFLVATVVLGTLTLVFGAFAFHFMRMIAGDPHQPAFASGSKTSPLEFAVMGVCTACLITFGLWVPTGFQSLLRHAVEVVQR